MRRSSAWRYIACVLSFCVLGISVGHAEQGPDSENTNFSFREDGLANGLISNWLTVLSYDSVPKKVRKVSALNLYAFVFQYWLVTEHQGRKNPLLDKREVAVIMSRVKEYVSLDDPLSISPFYERDTLNAVGLTRASLQPLLHADDIFEKKQTYQKLVAEFAHWRDSLKSPSENNRQTCP
jgi:hypothetical protein